MLQKELSMMSEQIQSRLDEQQKTFKCVEDQLTSNLKKKEDECREVMQCIIVPLNVPISTASRRA